MLRVPSARRRKKPAIKLNMIPVMDIIIVFIFFLLMSGTYLKIYEVDSAVPIISDLVPLEDDINTLGLTLAIKSNEMILSKGIPSQLIHKFQRQADGLFNYEELHTVLVGIKKANVRENSIIFEPVDDLSYEEIVRIMDTVRNLNNTDEAIYRTNKDGIDEKLKVLFSKIIFSNLMS